MSKPISHFVAQLVAGLFLFGCGQISDRQPIKIEESTRASAATRSAKAVRQDEQNAQADSVVKPNGSHEDSEPEAVAVRANVAPANDARTVPLIQLIDELTAMSEDDEVAKMLWEGYFRLPLESSLWQPAEIGIERASSTFSAVRELIRRGIVALPDLLRHVDDRRPTRITIRQVSPVSSFWRRNWFDPRFRLDESRHPVGIAAIEVESANLSGESPAYTVTVGDVCYFVIGQIVNRNLRILHCRITRSILITSPTASPVLAGAIRSDWGRITATEHCQSLVDDARQWMSPGDALQRLVMYYPDEVEDISLELLQRPLYYKSPPDDLVCDLLKTGNRGDWNLVYDDFREKYGFSMEADIQSRLHEVARRQPRRRESTRDIEHRQRASRILADFYPTFDSNSTAPPTHATYAIQTSVVSGLRGSPASEKLDAAIYRVFEETNAAAFQDEFVRHDFDLLAIACVRRIAGSRYDNALRDFVDKRISAIDQLPRSLAAKTCVQEFRTVSASLQKPR